MHRTTVITLLIVLTTVLAALLISRPSHSVAAPPADPAKPATAGEPLAQLEQLQKQIKDLEALVPDQAAVMSHVAYHFSNLWFAVEQENWPLADFYLGETRNNIKWAVRAKPIRKTAAGQEIDLGAIAQALDNTQFTELKKAIAAKQKEQCIKLYDQTLEGCYACHKASEKPYLRPQRPARPEVPIINFDPKATTPP